MSDTQPQSLNLPGGIPDHKDLAPSAVFLVLYILASGLLIMSWKRNTIGKWFMVRPTVFFVTRLVFFILRIVLIKNGLTEGLFIADLVLVMVGFVFLLEPTISLWEHHEKQKYKGQEHPRLLRVSSIILQGLLYVAIGTGAAAGGLIGKALGDPDTLSTVTTLRKISYALSLAVVAAMFLIYAYSLVTRRWTAHWGTSLLMMAYVSALMVIAVYRIINSETSDPQAWARSKTAFWVLQIAFEWVAALVLLLLVNLIAGTETHLGGTDHLMREPAYKAVV